MQVIRESACQRRHHRVTAPLRITAEDGSVCSAENWSLGGIKIADWNGPVIEMGETVKLDLHIPFQGFDITFAVQARIVRIERENEVFAAEFTELPQRAEELMRHFIDDLIRGKMASIEDTICRIDVPVTPISTKPDPNPTEEVPVKRWPIKTIVMSGLYITLGLFVFAYASLLLYSNIMRMEVKTAVVSAPLLTIKMPVAGQLEPVRYEKGQRVNKGDLLARITNPVLDVKIEEAKQKVRQATDALLRMEQKAHVEKERMKLYQLVSDTDYNIAAARIEAQREELKAADAHFVRISALAEKGHMAPAKVDEARHRQALAVSRLREAELNHQQASAMRSTSQRRHYNHKVFVVDLDLVELDLSAARSALTAATSRLDGLVRRKNNQIITAPTDGEIVAVFASPDIGLERNEPLLTIEASDQLSVTAFLSQDEVLNVGLASHASVFLPALGDYVEGRVTSIDRSATAINPKANHYQWNEAEERSAAVSIDLDPDQPQLNKVRAGLPAIVSFDRAQIGVTAQVRHWLRERGGENADADI